MPEIILNRLIGIGASKNKNHRMCDEKENIP